MCKYDGKVQHTPTSILAQENLLVSEYGNKIKDHLFDTVDVNYGN